MSSTGKLTLTFIPGCYHPSYRSSKTSLAESRSEAPTRCCPLTIQKQGTFARRSSRRRYQRRCTADRRSSRRRERRPRGGVSVHQRQSGLGADARRPGMLGGIPGHWDPSELRRFRLRCSPGPGTASKHTSPSRRLTASSRLDAHRYLDDRDLASRDEAEGEKRRCARYSSGVR